MRPLPFALALLGSIALACSERDGAATPVSPPATPAAASSEPAAATSDAPSAKRDEKPLPSFEGTTLAGERLAVAELLGKRLLLVFFNPEVREAEVAAEAVQSIAGERGDHNFEIVGVAMGSSRAAVERFVAERGLDFRVIDDSSGAIAQRLGLRVPAAILGVDAEGYVVYGLGAFPTEGPSPAAAVASQLREAYRLPGVGVSLAPALGERPRAPEFTGQRLEGGEPLRSATLRGRPLLLVFFLHTCPHCHHELEFLREYLPTIPEGQRPQLVGVSVSEQALAVRETLKQDKLDFFPVLLDADFKIRNAFGVVAGVPDSFLIDAEGRVVARVQGWRDDRDPPLMKMRLAKLAGAPVPMLLHQTGYSGKEFCGVCHDSQQDTWLLTNHASAFDTLVKHGASRDAECVSCHVVGWGQSGGYTLKPPTPHLEDVGCETCHGRGGPHLSPGFVKDGSYQAICVTCHDTKHSLGFEYAQFLPRVSHAANSELAKLPLDEKRRILASRRKPRENLLPASASFVGSDACQSCHAAEYATWTQQAHARSIASLESKKATGNADCLRCHTTGFGRSGGFPPGASPAAHEALAAVGCESCHGPGGDHVKEGATRVGTIVSLGDKCDSCVILQICGSCHDAANDPGFEFEVKQKIEKQRHGTLEPGTGKPKRAARWLPASPHARHPSEAAASVVLGTLEHAFRRLDREG